MARFYPISRLRRLRWTSALRSLLQETEVKLSSLVMPIFVEEEIRDYVSISGMPGIVRIPESRLAFEIDRYAKVGIQSIITFWISHHLDEIGSDTWHENGLVTRIVRICKETVPEMIVMADICFCEYTTHGHCGVIYDNNVDNDATIANLRRQALAVARAGADVVSPSSSMDGQVHAIRSALDEAGYKDTMIMSYLTKFASAFYGTFREASGIVLKGDRKSYQINPMNRREAIRESILDEKEGADVQMVKPAGAFLDIIRDIREAIYLPLAAYQVSGEYAMIKFSAAAGAINERQIVRETLGAIKRAGADIILSYFTLDIAEQGF